MTNEDPSSRHHASFVISTAKSDSHINLYYYSFALGIFSPSSELLLTSFRSHVTRLADGKCIMQHKFDTHMCTFLRKSVPPRVLCCTRRMYAGEYHIIRVALDRALRQGPSRGIHQQNTECSNLSHCWVISVSPYYCRLLVIWVMITTFTCNAASFTLYNPSSHLPLSNQKL